MRTVLTSLFAHHTLYFLRVDLHFLGVRLRNWISLRNPAKIKPNARFLNIACGPNAIDDEAWFNLEGWSCQGVDYLCDLRRRLPFASNRFEGIFCEHFFEHLTPRDAAAFLEECLRILKPNGVVRLSVPDGKLYMENYFNDRNWMLERRSRSRRTPMEIVNDVFRQRYEHQYCYDGETLILHLADAGFTDTTVTDFGEGTLKELLIDQEDRIFESLYAEARKP